MAVYIGNDIVKAFTGGNSVKAIYSEGVKVWPVVSVENEELSLTLTKNDWVIREELWNVGSDILQLYKTKENTTVYTTYVYKLLEDYSKYKIKYTLDTCSAYVGSGVFLDSVGNVCSIQKDDRHYFWVGSTKVNYQGWFEGVSAYDIWHKDSKTYWNVDDSSCAYQSVIFKDLTSSSSSGRFTLNYYWYDENGDIFNFNGRNVWSDTRTNQYYMSNGTNTYHLNGKVWEVVTMNTPSDMGGLNGENVFNIGTKTLYMKNLKEWYFLCSDGITWKKADVTLPSTWTSNIGLQYNSICNDYEGNLLLGIKTSTGSGSGYYYAHTLNINS